MNDYKTRLEEAKRKIRALDFKRRLEKEARTLENANAWKDERDETIEGKPFKPPHIKRNNPTED